ncbi:MAG: hypothetical protein LW847_03975 [Burkholderiales bacterium]|jgi:hypothetical protein|nr:hypothetical protein [Burkholderiales bacterium]
MKRERLHDWLIDYCPAYRNLGADERALVLSEVIAAYETETSKRFRHLPWVLAVLAVGATFMWWHLGESPFGLIAALLPALAGLGGARIFVAEYVERKVRERAEVRARGFFLARQRGV